MSNKAPPTAHLVHGMGKELEAPVWPHLTETEVSDILTQFPDSGELGALLWHSPRPFSATSLLETSAGEFLLKRHHISLRTTETLAAEHQFMAHLSARSLPVPEVLATEQGHTALSKGSWTYELHRRSKGLDLYRDYQSWTPFLAPNHSYEAGRALALLHKASEDFAAPERNGQPLISTMGILRSADPLNAMEAYVRRHPAVSAYLADKPWRQAAKDIFRNLGTGLPERIAAQHSMWTHNDWHPSNMLWSSNGQVESIIDFGLSTRTCALHDLATAMERTAFPWLDADIGVLCGEGNPDTALSILNGYRSVISLSHNDIETLIQLLPLVHIEFALSEVDYFYGLLSDRNQADLAWYGYFIDHAEWFQSAIGRDFLQSFKSGAFA